MTRTRSEIPPAVVSWGKLQESSLGCTEVVRGDGRNPVSIFRATNGTR
jgi:hypothetical protein